MSEHKQGQRNLSTDTVEQDNGDLMPSSNADPVSREAVHSDNNVADSMREQNNNSPGIIATFDQRFQNVKNQYNAARDIYINYTTNFLGFRTLVIIFGVALLSLVLLWWYIRPKPVPRMTSGIIRVAFPQLDAGLPEPLLESDELSERTQMLAANLEETIVPKLQAMGIPFTIWGPTRFVGVETALDNPYLLAQQVNANIVMDGTLGENEALHTGRLSLSLYVTDVNATDGGELLGSYYLGAPVEYVPPFYSVGTQRKANEVLQRRIEIISNVMLALADLIEPYDTANYERVKAHLDDALDNLRAGGSLRIVTPTQCPPGYVPPTAEVNASDPQAEATIMVLKGNAAASAGLFDEAIEHYTIATTLACDYARPYLGIANTLIRRAILESPPKALLATDSVALQQYRERLEQAHNYFVWAQQATWRPENAFFTERITYGLAEWHLAHTRLPDGDTEQSFASAHAMYTQLIDQYELDPTSKQHHVFLSELIASAYALRASAEIGTANYAAALGDLQHAAERTVNAAQQTKWLIMQGHIYIYQQDCINAQEKLREAEMTIRRTSIPATETQILQQEITLFSEQLMQNCKTSSTSP